MFAGLARADQAYRTVGLETGVPAADPHRLVLMLFDGAVAAVSAARAHLLAGQTARKGELIGKAVNIVMNGLLASLDKGHGGALADHLAELYEYIALKLVRSGAADDAAGLDEAIRLLSELRSAWEQIASPATAVAPGRPAP